MDQVKATETITRLSNAPAGYTLTEDDKKDLRMAAKEISDLRNAVDTVRKRLRKTVDELLS